MCPMCISTVALTVAGATSTGGLTALVLKKLLRKSSANKAHQNPDQKGELVRRQVRRSGRRWPMVLTMRNGLIAVAVLCTAVPAILVAQSAEKKTLVGVWEVKISAGGQPPPPILSIAIFGGDGSFTTTGNTKIASDLADQRGPGYGRWAQTSDSEFKLTFYAVLLKEGEVNGYLRVRSTMILSKSGNEFTTSDCRVDFLDANWKLVDSDNDEVKGTRLETP